MGRARQGRGAEDVTAARRWSRSTAALASRVSLAPGAPLARSTAARRHRKSWKHAWLFAFYIEGGMHRLREWSDARKTSAFAVAPLAPPRRPWDGRRPVRRPASGALYPHAR